MERSYPKRGSFSIKSLKRRSTVTEDYLGSSEFGRHTKYPRLKSWKEDVTVWKLRIRTINL